jgi:glycosyltransferase involved in cell wall biosynthesis
MNKVLILTYYWPPGSGAGVQRWLKFAKYLPDEGWEPLILTADPEYAAYPVTDRSLENEVPPDLKVFRTKATDWFRLYSRDKAKIPSAGFASNDYNSITGKISKFIRGNFFIPDPRKGWNKYAVKEAARLIETHGIQNLITTSPPHSTQLAGLKIKKLSPSIRWLADLRDPWTDIYYYDSFYHTPAARYLDARYEKMVLTRADHIITVGKSLKNVFSSKLEGGEDKISVIPNGYDPDDFRIASQPLPDIFTVSYIGTLSDAYPIIGFIEAVRNLAGKGYKIKLRFVGSVSPAQKVAAGSLSGNISAEFIPYVSHGDAIKYMMGSSVLLLIIPDHSSSKSIITGKVFEYMASGRPVLCLGPEDGDAAEILETTGNGKCATYNDTGSIESVLEEYLNKPVQDLKSPSAFSRQSLARDLALLLETDK